MHRYESDLESLSHLWDNQKNDYVLLKVDGSDRTATDGCLIYNVKEHSTLVLEDEHLAQEVMTKMKAAGMPVLLRSELPLQKNELEQLINQLIESGKPPHEINSAITAYENNRRGV